MVDFFFLLSGMVLAYIYHSMFADGVSARNYGDFLMARVARCMPMVVLASILAFAANRLLAVATPG